MYKKICSNMKIIAVAAIVLTTVFILTACYSFFNMRLNQELESEADMVAGVINISEEPLGLLKTVENSFKDKRVTYIDGSGKVLYDNEANVGLMDNHSDRPEFIQAISEGHGESERRSSTLLKKIYYCAVRLDDGSVIRISKESSGVLELFLRILIPIIIIFGVVYVITVILSVLLTEKITQPINNIDLSAEHGQEGIYEEMLPLVRRVQSQNIEIRRQMEKVKAQKNRLQILSDSMNEGLVMLDSEKNIISTNSSALSIFGVEYENIIYRNFLHMTRNIDISEHMENGYKGNKDWFSTEIGGKKYEIFYSPVIQNDNVTSLIMLVFDISEKEKAEQVRQEFTANVSHELKTPLTTILGYTQIINKGIAKQEDIKEFTGRILKETTRLIALVDDIMKLSRLDAAALTEKEPILLSDIVSEVSEMLKPAAKSKEVAISCDCDDSLVEGDRTQITEIIYNLTDNAVKYNKDGGSVFISVKDNVLSVRDTGIGIPEEYKDRIYERFFRVDKSHSKKIGGTGLGLSIVKHAAMCHDASVSVVSKEGVGTEFTVRFPS